MAKARTRQWKNKQKDQKAIKIKRIKRRSNFAQNIQDSRFGSFDFLSSISVDHL